MTRLFPAPILVKQALHRFGVFVRLVANARILWRAAILVLGVELRAMLEQPPGYRETSVAGGRVERSHPPLVAGIYIGPRGDQLFGNLIAVPKRSLV